MHSHFTKLDSKPDKQTGTDWKSVGTGLNRV